MTVLALVHTIKKTGQVLLITSVLTLLVLIAAGAGLFHPAGVQFATGTNGTINVGGGYLAETNGEIHVGGAQLAAEGDIRIGS